ncbi:MAG TPA: helical backbone metal receptor [Tepidisphaeraceae bacterium]|nr:helical backbone metal receptor [Tepidisphaeraceae bacterium]
MLIGLGIGLCGCEKSPAPAARPSTAPSASAPSGLPTVASLVPAATDLIIGMGAADQLVAISNFDEDRDETRNLPRVGDYQKYDWEKLSQIRPSLMIMFYDPARMATGLREHLDELHTELINIKTERLSDIFSAITSLGEKLRQPEKARQAGAQLKHTLDDVQSRVAGRPIIPTLIVTSDEGTLACGPDTFLNDLLEIAGGKNVITISTPRYPQLDREQIAQMAPQAIIQLLPNATPAMQEQAAKFWRGLPDVPAVKNKRICVLTDWYVVQPGYNVGKLAEQFAACLHPESTTAPTSPPLRVKP